LTEIAKSKQITSEALANVWLIEKIKEQTNSNQQFRINVSTGFRIEGFSKKVMNSFGMNDWILVDSCIWATNYRINECTVLLTNL
jgi:phage-related protein